jgi:putative transposase
MTSIIEVRKTYKYRMYASQHDFRLHDTINIAGIIWNHITALQRRYYRRFGKHIAQARMEKHIAYLRMKTRKYAYWRQVGSQAVQELCQRHEAAYERFFQKKGGLPRFKKVKQFRSFVLKQAGWKLGADTHQRGGKKHPKWTGHIAIDGVDYKFVKHRPMKGDIKTVRVKRDSLGRLWICFSVVETMTIENTTTTGKSGGFDFGLKTFLVNDTGQAIVMPEFYKADLPRMKAIQRQVSKKQKGSTNQNEGKRHINRRHVRIADKRRDFHFKLAHLLCDDYDVLVFEDLNIAAMKKRWGRKVSDLGFAQFLEIIKWVSFKRGKKLIQIDRWDRTTGKCSNPQCKHEQALDLKTRTFCCAKCGLVLDRDHNAAINIRELGHQLMLSQSIEVHSEKTQKAVGVNGRSPQL